MTELKTVSKTEACMCLGVLVNAVNRLIKKGELAAVTVPGERYERITTSSLEKYIDVITTDLDERSNKLKKSLRSLQVA